MALDANLDIKAGRLNPDVAAHSVAIAKSAFLPQVQSTLRKNSQVSQPSDFTQGRSDISTGGVSVSGSVAQNVAFYGGSYSVTWLGSRGTQSGGFPSFNPNIYSSLDLGYSQPLLRGLKIDSARVGVTNAEQRRVITDLQLEQQVVSMEASVRLAYLGLVGAIEGRKVAESNLDIAETSLRQSKARVQVGQAPQIEIIQFEAQAATARERMIATEAEIRGLKTACARWFSIRRVPTTGPFACFPRIRFCSRNARWMWTPPSRTRWPIVWTSRRNGVRWTSRT
jgi:outer membrane protein TolC